MEEEALRFQVDHRVVEFEVQRPFQETILWWILPAAALSLWAATADELALMLGIGCAGAIVSYLAYSLWMLRGVPRSIRLDDDKIEVEYGRAKAAFEFRRMRLVLFEATPAYEDDGSYDMTIFWEEGEPQRQTGLALSKFAYFFNFVESDYRRIKSWVVRHLPREKIVSA